MLVIECRDVVEIYDVTELILETDNITLIVNEKDFLDWHGSLALDGSKNNLERLSSAMDRILTVTFRHKNKRYAGLITINVAPADLGRLCWVEFRGVDLLRVVRGG